MFPSTRRIFVVLSIRALSFDVVIAYGLMHCLPDEREVRSLCALLQEATKESGYLILCAFNDRFQDLSAHPGFTPTLLPHATYLDMFSGVGHRRGVR